MNWYHLAWSRRRERCCAGILVAANNVTVDSFQVDNAFVGLYADTGATGVTFSNSLVSDAGPAGIVPAASVFGARPDMGGVEN
jgi:hypothetical protein